MIKLTAEEYGDLLDHRAKFDRCLLVTIDPRGVWLMSDARNRWAQDRVNANRRQAAIDAAEKERLSQEQRCKCGTRLMAVTPISTEPPHNPHQTLCPVYLHELRGAVRSHREKLDRIDAKHGVTNE